MPVGPGRHPGLRPIGNGGESAIGKGQSGNGTRGAEQDGSRREPLSRPELAERSDANKGARWPGAALIRCYRLCESCRGRTLVIGEGKVLDDEAGIVV